MTNETGQKKSYVEQELDKVINQLKIFEDGINLPNIPLTASEKGDLDGYLRLDRISWEKTSAEECGYICIFLAQYSYKLQYVYNRQLAQMNYIKKIIDSKAWVAADNYAGSWEMQYHKAIKGDSFLSQCYETYLMLDVRCQNLKGLGDTIKNLSDSIKNIRYTKAKQND